MNIFVVIVKILRTISIQISSMPFPGFRRLSVENFKMKTKKNIMKQKNNNFEIEAYNFTIITIIKLKQQQQQQQQ